MVRFLAFLLPLALWLMGNSARAVAPVYLSDKDLAASPIVVVAQWEKKPVEWHGKFREHDLLGKVVDQSESHTKLRILRVIKGPGLKAGEHNLLLGWAIGWDKEGKYLNSATSTQLAGDVDDIAVPQLWFLKKGKSWDEKRPGEFLLADNYRQIQPLCLEPYFLALASGRPDLGVPQLLSSKEHEVVERTLRYISGGVWPWPYEPDEFERFWRDEERAKPLAGEAERVRQFAQSDAAENLRALAASIYADLAGREGLPKVRELLADKSPLVRGLAVGILARQRDEVSIARFSDALRGLKDGLVACKVVEQLGSWSDERLVPSLIAFLNDDQFVYRYGDDLGIPALRARRELHRITGRWFPYDVAAAREVWNAALERKNPQERKALLEKLVPDLECPLEAELIGEAAVEKEQAEPGSKTELKSGEKLEELEAQEPELNATVRVRNKGSRPLTIAKAPSEVCVRSPGGMSSYGSWEKQPDQTAFVTLAAGESAEFKVRFSPSFLIAERKERELTLSYLDGGSAAGTKAWIGVVHVAFGLEWKEVRVQKKVEELWPNGNLKAHGSTINGQRFGEWHFFNEQGDRIRIVHYQSGRGQSECNPEHPDNKGAGKRAVKDGVPPARPATD